MYPPFVEINPLIYSYIRNLNQCLVQFWLLNPHGSKCLTTPHTVSLRYPVRQRYSAYFNYFKNTKKAPHSNQISYETYVNITKIHVIIGIVFAILTCIIYIFFRPSRKCESSAHRIAMAVTCQKCRYTFQEA